MKKHTGKLTFAYMLTAGAVMGLGGCELTDPTSADKQTQIKALSPTRESAFFDIHLNVIK